MITSGDIPTLFRMLNGRPGGKRNRIFTYIYDYIVTGSGNPLNTVCCKRRTIIFQKCVLNILKQNRVWVSLLFLVKWTFKCRYHI